MTTKIESGNPEEIEFLLSAQAIRDRTRVLYEAAKKGQTHFSLHPEKLDEVVKLVMEVTRAQYPDLKIPFHSRWNHFKVGSWDRIGAVVKKMQKLSQLEKLQSLLDLVVVSVLLDAGAGAAWKIYDAQSGQNFGRSEGLALGSLFMFERGDFSSDPQQPFRVDAEGLEALTLDKLQNGFQVTDMNPMVGLQGRLNLLKRLGTTIRKKKKFFPGEIDRPGNLANYFLEQFQDKTLPAGEILRAVLYGLGPIWPGRIQVDDVNVGDVWEHPLLGPESSTGALVPFHKLSQWLTYSLIEPLQDYGFKVDGIEKLTGLAEYRNGGLILDTGLVQLRDPGLAQEVHPVSSALVVEWRALTIAFLDQIGVGVCKALQKSPKEFPLAKVLEGGTWWAGRKIAFQKRPDGASPLKIESDGTVF